MSVNTLYQRDIFFYNLGTNCFSLISFPMKISFQFSCTLILLFTAIAYPTHSIGAVRIIELPSSNLLHDSISPKPLQVIQVYGTITPTDTTAIEKLLTSIRGIVSLNSVGGSVDAAMALGRILRRENLPVTIGPDDVCISACVLVLAGAPFRSFFGGKIGIHRPFIEFDTAITSEQQKTQYEEIEKVIKSYLREMNVDTRLYEDMFRISPSNIKYLSESERLAYGLDGTDPYIEQAANASKAMKLGISTTELLHRENEAWNKCRNRKADTAKCWMSIEIGISEKEYDRRKNTALSLCASETTKAEQLLCHDRIVFGSKK